MRTCEENLALRAWAKAPLTPAQELRQLLAHPDLRRVYRRLARRALESGDPQAIAEELTELRREVARAEASALQIRTLFPTLLPCLAALKASPTP